jgi:selenocysteine lyase/cysteine desulfurase
VERIQSRGELRFCFIDAAQAFCQVPLDDCCQFADFIVAGSHKWMGAYLPTGIGFFGRRRSRQMIEDRVISLSVQSGDPLLHFTEQLDNGRLDGHSETANLTSLFACAGAASHWLNTTGSRASELPSKEDVVARIPRPSADWQPRLSDVSFRSRIVLFESQALRGQQVCRELTRRNWLEAGSIVTAYSDGLTRISLPH